MSGEKLLDEREVAARLNVSVSRVRQLRYAGREPHPIKVHGILVRYPVAAVERVRRERAARGGAR
jgi:predicted DNA-binding transcriptional regulator AlpA